MLTQIRRLCFWICCIHILAGCSVHYTHVTLSTDGSLSVPPNVEIDHKILKLSQALRTLSGHIEQDEANRLARSVVLYTLYLQESYTVTRPPTFNNILINLGIKERGLCYHWAGDLRNFLSGQDFKSFDFYWAVHAQRSVFEHNALVVTHAGDSFYDGLLLDPWRDSTELFFIPVSLDKSYEWTESHIHPPIKAKPVL